jgi:hypothetical protein
MRSVNGYPCRNCADEELAKRGIDPAHPTRPGSGSNASGKSAELGVNRPESSGEQGRKLNLYA